MKRMNRCLAMLLALTLLLLAGCTNAPEPTTTAPTAATAGKRPSVPIIGDVDTTEATKPSGNWDINNDPGIRFLPEELDNPEGLPVLTGGIPCL